MTLPVPDDEVEAQRLFHERDDLHWQLRDIDTQQARRQTHIVQLPDRAHRLTAHTEMVRLADDANALNGEFQRVNMTLSTRRATMQATRGPLSVEGRVSALRPGFTGASTPLPATLAPRTPGQGH